MQAAEARRAVAAAMSVAAALDLAAQDAVVLNDSNRLVVRLLPCDIVARVSSATHDGSAGREVEVVNRLAGTGSPVAGLDPRVEARVVEHDGFEVAMWTYFEPAESQEVPPSDYADALERLHGALRQIDVTTPHFTDRVADLQRAVLSQDVSPDLADRDRTFLANALRALTRSIVDRDAAEQVLHGEPHPGNVFNTKNGPLFIDFEYTTRGSVEYDLAWAPKEVSVRYPNADQDLLGECRGLVLALVAAYFWRRDDQHPSGMQGAVAYLNALRDGPPWATCDGVTW